MGGLKQKTEDYNYVWARFMDATDEAYDIENFNPDDIWKDPNRRFSKNQAYDERQFKLSLGRMVKNIRKQLEANKSGCKFAGLQSLLCGYLISLTICAIAESGA
jgi:hypothetical protein